MCGFVGFIDENDQTYDHRATIVAMANAIAHRGPDSEGYFSDGRAALGFRRLASSIWPVRTSPSITRIARSCSSSTAKSTTTRNYAGS